MSHEHSEKVYTYESDYGSYLLQPWISTYKNNGNLALGFNYYDKEYECWDPFCYATVNIIPLGYLESAIDTNDNGLRFLDFLEKSGFGQRTGSVLPSGYCLYPVFRFNEERLKEINPKVFAEYQKGYGKDKQPLAEKICSAEGKTDKVSPEHAGKEPVR